MNTEPIWVLFEKYGDDGERAELEAAVKKAPIGRLATKQSKLITLPFTDCAVKDVCL